MFATGVVDVVEATVGIVAAVIAAVFAKAIMAGGGAA